MGLRVVDRGHVSLKYRLCMHSACVCAYAGPHVKQGSGGPASVQGTMAVSSGDASCAPIMPTAVPFDAVDASAGGYADY